MALSRSRIRRLPRGQGRAGTLLRPHAMLTWGFAIAFSLAVGLAVGNLGAYVRLQAARYLDKR